MTSISEDNRVLGTLRRMDSGKGAVRMEDVYDTDIDDLWTALTEPRRLSRWLGDVDGELRPGGQFQARFSSTWEGPGRVDACDAPRSLSVTLNPGEDDATVLEATLARDGEKTRLVIEERGLPFDDLAAYGAGWQAHVEDLAAHLAGRDAGDWRTRWEELRPVYGRLHGKQT